MYKYFGYSNIMFPIQIVIKRGYSSHQTYYDILNLKPNCTTKEIRDSFLKLSKEFHPDLKGPDGDPRNTAKFVKVREAYNILSKKRDRAAYDLSLHYNYTTPRAGATVNQSSSGMHFHNANPNSEHYYGVKGIQKVSNLKIVGILLILAALGTALEFYLVRHSFTLRRDRLDEISKEAGIQLASVRADAEKYGNEKQLERITEKLLKANET